MSRLKPLVVAACHIPATLLVAAAAGHWWRGFFPCVCSVVGGCAALLVFIAQNRGARRWMWAMVAMHLRSLLPMHLGRPTWQGFVLLAAGIFVAAGLGLRDASGAQETGLPAEALPRGGPPRYHRGGLGGQEAKGIGAQVNTTHGNPLAVAKGAPWTGSKPGRIEIT
ncbi:MAG: hypothetical protein ACHQ7N_05530 [Candidatus Methylomirabilales bacterium]